MLGLANTSCRADLQRLGGHRWMRSATRTASMGSRMSSRRMTNSSPPKRASVLPPASPSRLAHPAHDVVAPDGGGQPLREGDEQLIAGGVAEAVVDVLEAIEIDEQHREHVVGWRTRRLIARLRRSRNSIRLGSRVSGS